MTTMQFALGRFGRGLRPAEELRLDTLLGRVFQVMSDYQPHTLRELADRCHGGEASVSARIRELHTKFGFEYSKKEVRAGLYEYQLRREQ